MIFGKVMNCPALQVNKAVTGTTLTGVWHPQRHGSVGRRCRTAPTIRSITLSLLQMVIQINHLKKVKECWAPCVPHAD